MINFNFNKKKKKIQKKKKKPGCLDILKYIMIFFNQFFIKKLKQKIVLNFNISLINPYSSSNCKDNQLFL